ncbi:hypothetical protein [Fimbriimonas ginsengisoli]|uniref:Uncharacterized protein n=1 Tax=Fimbriimonas ginsengisoli Gsoil 348 TaxID=661478 RepID=A0A068NWC4_FIMGI|nr:hypothetical protein [Fimbriimonas ginsengisoli]AIE87833.1 hypothetical protein OP10G_4465 [Fimbriimonas ginsengisoli Gsoil 348]
MQPPPSYMSSPPKKKSTGLIIGLVIGGIFLCCLLPLGLLAGGGLWAFNNSKPFIGCSMAYSGVRTAVMQYAHAHKEKLPKAETWMDDVRPYYQKEYAKTSDDAGKMFKLMPPEGAWSCEDGAGGHTGMAFNKELSGKALDSIKNKDTTFMVFETPTPPSNNLSAKYEELPHATSPKIFGKPRGWFRVPVEGDVLMGKKRAPNANGNIQVNVDDKSSN